MPENDLMTDEELRVRYPELAPRLKLDKGQTAEVTPKAELPEGVTARTVFNPAPVTPQSSEQPQAQRFDAGKYQTDNSEPDFLTEKSSSGEVQRFDSSPYSGKSKQNRWGAFTTTKDGQPFQQTIFDTQVVRVIDGDTFEATVMVNGTPQKVKIRLRGADAPETGLGGLGARERDALKGVLSRGPVVVVNPRYDPDSGRYEADVRTNEVSDVSKWMLKNGYAKDWLGTPPDWPKDNEWRQLWKNMSIEDQLKWREVAAEHRRFGLMRSGRWGYKERPTKEQLQAFQKLSNQFMSEYVRPWRQKTGRWQPPVQAPTQGAPSTSTNPMDRALDETIGVGGGGPAKPFEPFDPRKVTFNFDRPTGHGEYSSWERSLWPKEKQILSILKRKEEEFKRNAPRGWDDRAAYMRDPAYVSFKKYYEKFMDLTTKRWRTHRKQLDYQYQHRRRGRGGSRGIIRMGENENPNVPAVKTAMVTELRSHNATDNAIKGIFMNVADESRFNPGSRHPDQPRFRGEAHYAHGLYQEGGTEWQRYAGWLQRHHQGKDWRDPGLQTKFLALNLKANYPQVWQRMNAARTPGEAAVAFVAGYLKPASHHLRNRVNRYRQYS